MYISNTNYTLTGFTQNRANTTIGGSRPWVAFGKQKQWGAKTFTETYDWNGTVNLPLSVNTIYSIATTLNSCSNYAIVGIAIQSTTKSSFSVKLDGVNDSSRTTGFKYILIAKQKQWGFATWAEGGNPVNVTLPLPFPNQKYLILACAYGGIDNFHTAALNTVTTNITSNSKYQLATYDYDRRYNYFAIGF